MTTISLTYSLFIIVMLLNYLYKPSLLSHVGIISDMQANSSCAFIVRLRGNGILLGMIIL